MDLEVAVDRARELVRQRDIDRFVVFGLMNPEPKPITALGCHEMGADFDLGKVPHADRAGGQERYDKAVPEHLCFGSKTKPRRGLRPHP